MPACCGSMDISLLKDIYDQRKIYAAIYDQRKIYAALFFEVYKMQKETGLHGIENE